MFLWKKTEIIAVMEKVKQYFSKVCYLNIIAIQQCLLCFLTLLSFCTQKPCSLWEDFLKAQRMQDHVEVRHGHTGCVFGTWYIIPLLVSCNSWVREYTFFRESSVAGVYRWDIAQMCVGDMQRTVLCYLFSECLYVMELPIHNSDVRESHFPELPSWFIGSF